MNLPPETLADYRAELRFLRREQARVERRISELEQIVDWPPQQRRRA